MTHNEAITAGLNEIRESVAEQVAKAMLTGEAWTRTTINGTDPFDTSEIRARFQRRVDEYLAQKPRDIYADDITDLAK